MSELAYVQRECGWSIGRDITDGFEWWCGTRHGWVSPASGWWHLVPECLNVVYPSLDAARRYARSQGWEQAPARRRTA